MTAAGPQRVSPPRCILHIPNCAGSSVDAALEAALPLGSLAPRRFDRAIFADFEDFGLLRQDARDPVALDDEEVGALAGYLAVSGHFSLPSLLRIADASSICTVLREPRARLLSLYMYLRVPGIDDFLAPYRLSHHARRPLCEFLAGPQLVSLVDNQICRMLLYGDPRLPEAGFVAPADVEPIAADAVERLETLGFVGFMERGEEVWRRLADLFDVRLEPAKANGIDELERPLAIPPRRELLTSETLELLERRTAADRLVYDRTLARAGVGAEERSRLAQVAFAHELVKLGDLVGESSARLAAVHEQEHAIERLQAAVQRREEDLVRLRSWLDAVHGSRSWRLTVPLRTAKHRSIVCGQPATDWRPPSPIARFWPRGRWGKCGGSRLRCVRR